MTDLGTWLALRLPQDRGEVALILAGLGLLALVALVALVAVGRGRAAARAEAAGAGARLEAETMQRRAAEEVGARLREDLAGTRVAAGRVPDLEAELRELRQERDGEARRAAGLGQELKSLRDSHEARLEELRGMKRELEDRFASLASGVLKSNSETFLGLVTERFKQHSDGARQELETRQQAIQNLVKPLDEKLGLFDGHIRALEKARGEAYGAIQTQVLELTKGQQNLSQETRRLVQALRAPKTRGRWGEMQLRQVFEMAGMAEHVDYHMEASMDTEAGMRRPDAIVHIPGGKSVVVDAKTPLQAYLDALEADGPEAQQAQIVRHAGHIRQHVRLLASKAYQDAIPTTPDFVVMFIPGETFVAAAAEVDPGLLEYAFENRVLIATPTTLLALIKAIAYGWQQEKLAENAVEVQKSARELYDRLGVFAGHLEKVGRGLGQSVEAYNRAVGSLETRVLPSARKFEAMGVVAPPVPLSGPSGVESEPRVLTAPEFTAPEARGPETAESRTTAAEDASPAPAVHDEGRG